MGPLNHIMMSFDSDMELVFLQARQECRFFNLFRAMLAALRFAGTEKNYLR